MTTEYMEVKYGLKGVCKSSKILDPKQTIFLTLVSTLIVFPPQFFVTLVFVFRHR
jgi:hypothetical protein